ncbi:nicotinate-nucleotide adenylyltransferase, partial [Planctomycetota bacterium]
MKRTGLFGGTFDPPHNGHLRAAEACREGLSLDRVIFIPACIPPHKSARRLTAPSHRLAMLQTALAGDSGLEYSDIEIQRQGMSFTIDTIRAFTDPQTELFFITGSDSLAHLHLWKEVGLLLETCRVIIISRPGFSLEFPAVLQSALSPEALKNLKDQILELDTPDISSSQIRGLAAPDDDINDLVPQAVADYIRTE